MKDRHVINTVINLARQAADLNQIPFNEHLVRWGVVLTLHCKKLKQLIYEKLTPKELDFDFEYVAHEQLPQWIAAKQAGVSLEEWFEQQQKEQEAAATPTEKPEVVPDVLEK